MKIIIIFLLLNICAFETFACTCTTSTLAEKITRSEFVASAKIINIQPDLTNEQYHNIEIEIINLYKGNPINKLKIRSYLKSSCEFYTEKNSTWLIFASTTNGMLSFGYCSGAMQIYKEYDPIQYPTLNKRYKNRVDLKLSVLAYLKQKNISLTNNYGLNTLRFFDVSTKKNGFKGKKKDFSILSFQVNDDATISEIKLLKKFNNKKLSNAFLAFIKDSAKVVQSTLKTTPKKTTFYAIYYYYPSEDGYDSFISLIDL